MTILITGGNGYIATSLYEALKSKYKIHRITRSDFDLTNSNETNKFFENKYFDVVIHTAVKGGSRLKTEDSSIIDDNLMMYYNLLSNRSKFNKLIHFGSGAELFAIETPYGLSKKIIADSILEKDNFYNLRIYAVFDENELDTRFLKANIRRYIKKQPIEIHQDKYMSFFYMKDLIKVVDYYIMDNNLQKQLDCSYSHIYTLSEIANIINSLSEYKVEIIKKNPNIGNRYCGSNSQTYNIDYFGLEYGIKEVYEKLKNDK